MIPIPQPALALNSTDFGVSDHYTMRFNETVHRTLRPDNVVAMVSHGVRLAGEGGLAAIVINAHGMWGPDGVALGTGLHLGNTHLWSRVNGQIRRIWICACQVADTRAGWQFCQALAVASGAEVVGAVLPQVAATSDREFALDLAHGRLARIPPMHVDEYEGPVTIWLPDGRTTPFMRGR
ncbi:hypothetical protein J5Y09_16530 [Roseomonas sp. PWR1]|uniref:DUF4347 domain-containing protein n=1 Tax=Roseomonas nitratireducens TaxID=2820810 RepID=A0ABS4AW06_9PROT|nr:hypothetical protein [Neoroseomonas nitratireducens]MBP0465534.1 hypothetical protein [Neoroseomonas nitratireducens]